MNTNGMAIHLRINIQQFTNYIISISNLPGFSFGASGDFPCACFVIISKHESCHLVDVLLFLPQLTVSLEQTWSIFSVFRTVGTVDSNSFTFINS